MAEYIEKQALRDKLYEADAITLAGVKIINQFQPADVRPVRRGWWELDSDPGEPWKYRCNQCGETTTSTCMGEPRYHYCPMCGADMREVGNGSET